MTDPCASAGSPSTDPGPGEPVGASGATKTGPVPALMTEADGRPPPLRIGRLRIAPPLVLAPMSGLTNLPMRALCEEAGCGLTITEFLAAPALAGRVKKELAKITPSPEGRAWGAQIFGRDARQMARAARVCVEAGASLIDLNMGCPARKVTRGIAGAALMREPELAHDLLSAVLDAVQGQAEVTVKMRAGWDERSLNAPEFAAMMEASGASAVTVHGRTASQGFSGRSDPGIIARVKQAVRVPVIGNGDVTDLDTLEALFRTTGCDGVMIGRAALGNPWIFALARAWWLGQPGPPPPTVGDRLAMFLRHLDLYLGIAPCERAVVEMRKFAGWYLRGFDGAVALRKTINHTTRIEDIREILANWPSTDA